MSCSVLKNVDHMNRAQIGADLQQDPMMPAQLLLIDRPDFLLTLKTICWTSAILKTFT